MKIRNKNPTKKSAQRDSKDEVGGRQRRRRYYFVSISIRWAGLFLAKKTNKTISFDVTAMAGRGEGASVGGGG